MLLRGKMYPIFSACGCSLLPRRLPGWEPVLVGTGFEEVSVLWGKMNPIFSDPLLGGVLLVALVEPASEAGSVVWCAMGEFVLLVSNLT